MRYREYGKTGKRVSVIGFGGMRFGKDEEEGVRAMVRAAELGINYFDTAPGYCDDRSEPIFGKAFKLIKTPFYVSTKSSIQSQPKAGDIRGRIEEAMKRMNVEKIHFFNMWCLMDWEHFERVTAKGGPYEGALKAKEEGLIDHLVFSAHANGEEIRRMCESGLFEGVTLGYNILNHSNRFDGILAAHEKDMGVVVMNPLGGGMIPAGAEKLRFITGDRDETVVQAALRFVVAHPEVTVTLAGMGKAEEVEENAKVGERAAEPDPDMVEAIKERYDELGEVFCTACKYCLPCPAGINIPLILSALNRHRVGMTKEAPLYYDFFRKMSGDEWVPARDCTECAECEPRCTQHLPIQDLLKEAAKLFEKDL